VNSQGLINIGWQLARPCVNLNIARPSEPVVAVWGGDGIVPAPLGPYAHWISLACHALSRPAPADTGWLSVYVNTDDGVSGMIVVDPAAALPKHQKAGIALAGTPARSFPPIDAVTQVPQVHAWLVSQGIVHDPVQNAYFDDDDYNRVYQQECPLYSRDAIAVIGGWHFAWPDGDWQDLQNATLLIWTFRDAEPWVEAWQMSDGTFQVFRRIS
jgi:hypothetical protein